MKELHEKENGQSEGSIDPWLTIFFRPRTTIRWLLRHDTAESASMLWLSFTALVIVIMFVVLMLAPDITDLPARKMDLVIATPFIFALSYLYFITQCYLLTRVSVWLGGWTNSYQIRIVNAYTTVIPGVVFGVLNWVLILFLGAKDSLYYIIEYLILAWTLLISARGVAAAAGVPTWKGLLIYLITVVLWVVVISLGALLVQLMSSIF